jgi:hypothetical protein
MAAKTWDEIYGDDAGKDDDIAPSATITEAQLAQLDAMTPEQLKTLVRACNADRISYAIMTDDERKLALRVKLMTLAMLAKDDKVALNAISQLLDRIEGKPTQAVDVTVEDKGLGKLSTDRLLRLESELARITGSEALIIAPEPSLLISN